MIHLFNRYLGSSLLCTRPSKTRGTAGTRTGRVPDRIASICLVTTMVRCCPQHFVISLNPPMETGIISSPCYRRGNRLSDSPEVTELGCLETPTQACRTTLWWWNLLWGDKPKTLAQEHMVRQPPKPSRAAGSRPEQESRALVS